jgi:uncharacterized protein YegL
VSEYKFKVGDRVRINHPGDSNHDCITTIIEWDSNNFDGTVAVEGGLYDTQHDLTGVRFLELITSEETKDMNTLNKIENLEHMARDTIVIDGDTYKKVNGKKTTNVIVVLDMSGSMSSIHEPTMSGYNEYINSLKADKKSDYKVSLTVFDTQSVDKLYIATPIADVPKLTDKEYTPRAGTPLYDAVCGTLSSLQKDSATDEKYLVVIITDGEENSSRKYTEKDMKELKTALEAKGNFSFVYLGANQDAWGVASKWGFTPQNVASYNATTKGVGHTYAAASAATMRFAGSDQMMTYSSFTTQEVKDIEETK